MSQSKILKKSQITETISSLKSEGKKIVMTNGCFDILHVGHARYLAESKKQGEILIVAVNSDKSVKQLKGEDRPINNENDRAEMLVNLKSVDYAVIFDELTASEIMQEIKPDIYTKGADYSAADAEEQAKSLPEYPIASELGAKIVFIDFVEGKSSTKIIEALK